MTKIDRITIENESEYHDETMYEVIDYDYLGCGWCENGVSCYFTDKSEAIKYAEELYKQLDCEDNRYIAVTSVRTGIDDIGYGYTDPIND